MAQNKTTPNPTISVVMATYTGADNILRSLKSVANQKIKNFKIEMTVVVDGPNKELYELVESCRPAFDKADMDFHIEMLKKNKGRFQAMLTGAKMSGGKWLVLNGDRILWPPDFLAIMTKQGKEVAIADTVEEGWEKSSINLTLHHLRERLYKRKSGQPESLYINKENFEKSGKGTGGILINRQLFLWACSQVKNPNQKHTSDDTKILSILANNNHPIYWTNETHIIYCPRPGFKNQIGHIYHRGPRFINYYLQPGTRYYPPLMVTMAVTLAAIAAFIIKPSLLLWALVVLAAIIVISSLYLAQKPSDIPKLLWAIPVICAAFYIGLAKGLVIHFTHGKKLKVS